MNWISYKSLAWTERLVAPIEDYKEEVERYVEAIKRCKSSKPITMLHLGCGAGGHDYHLKKQFTLTGVDLSQGMLDIAKELNPEVDYLLGDMRSIRLNKKFDAVIIPDSIAYMSTLGDLRKVMDTAADHLKPAGILCIVATTKEEFSNNNFVYSGSDAETHITIFENNHVISDCNYEATLVYLIRQKGKLDIYHEVHTLGLFSHESWLDIFSASHFSVHEAFNMNDIYDKNVMEEGEYRLKVYICSLEK